MSLTVISPGPLSLVQDGGRSGSAGLGVGRSGALDRLALDVANRAVGNDATTAGLEVLLGGATIRVDSHALIAVAGANGDVLLDAETLAPGKAYEVRAGSSLTFRSPRAGARYYLAVRGGIRAESVLGSASWDGLAKLGTPPLAAGDVLQIGYGGTGKVNTWLPNPLAGRNVGHRFADIAAGPRRHLFSAADWHTLVTETWTVSPQSNRTALRLSGPALIFPEGLELSSEAVLPGAIQIPPDGQPIVFLADHPVTGGYPVIAVVRDESLDRLGQLLPGHQLGLSG